MPDTNVIAVLERVGIPAATSLGVCWAAVRWAFPKVLRAEIIAATQPERDALERRIAGQQKAVLEELSRHTGQLARSMEKMTDKIGEQAESLSELRGEVRAARATWSPYDRRNEPR